jgi:hypothetical protein
MFQRKPAYSWLSVIHAISFHYVNPLWEIQDYVEAFATQAACDAIPRFNVTPRNRQHIPNQAKV